MSTASPAGSAFAAGAPGETLPRPAFSLYWRREGKAMPFVPPVMQEAGGGEAVDPGPTKGRRPRRPGQRPDPI